MKFVIILCLLGLVACQHRRRPSHSRQGFRGFRPPQQSFRGFRPPQQGFRGFRPPQQGFRGFRPPQNLNFRPQTFPRPQNNLRSFAQQQAPANNVKSGGAPVDGSHGNSEYHFSWLHDGGLKYDGHGAHSYCKKLGGGWDAVGIINNSEGSYINGIIARHNQAYIWTGGQKKGQGFKWINREEFSYTDWSHTGGSKRPQPDNRERGGENCLAILNNFYQDGIKWHDVACHHTKPVICERH